MFDSIDKVKEFTTQNEMVLGYFSSESCNVCKDLFPKIEKMVEETYPKMELMRVDSESVPAYVGEYGIFVIPAVILFVQGKETIRRVRNFSVVELEDAISRYYDMIFE